MVQEKWWAPQKLAPQVVGTPKHTPQSPLPPTSILFPLTPPDPLSLLGPLRTSWGLRKPWEPLEAFSSLGSSVRLRGLAPLAPPHLPLLPLVHSHPLSPPEPPWVSLGPWNFPGASDRLGSLHKPLAPFGSLGSSVRLRGLASLAPPHPLLLPLTLSHTLSLPRPPWVPGTFLGPWEALGAFTNLRQPLVFSQTQGPCFPCSPSPPHSLSPPVAPSHPPEPPWVSLDLWDLPGVSGSLGSL